MRTRLAAFVVALLLGGCRAGEPAPPPAPVPPAPAEELPVIVDDGEPEVAGLRASIPRVAHGWPLTELTYRLEWTARPTCSFDPVTGTFTLEDAWLLDPLEPATVTAWGPSGDEVGRQTVHFGLPEEFLRQDQAVLDTPLRVSLPSGTAWVSVALGRSGLVTPRIRLEPKTWIIRVGEDLGAESGSGASIRR